MRTLDPSTVSAKARAALGLYRFRYGGREDALQQGIATAFDRARVRYEREYIFPGGRFDFLVEECVAVEVKVAGSLNDLLRQLARYSEVAEVGALLVITSRATLGRLPATLGGKAINVYTLPVEF